MKKILFLVLWTISSSLFNTNLNGMEQTGSNDPVHLPEFYLDTIINRTNKKFHLFIDKKPVRIIYPNQTIRISKKLAMQVDYKNPPYLKNMARISYAKNVNNIELLELDKREHYFLNVHYSLFAYPQKYSSVIDVYLIQETQQDEAVKIQKDLLKTDFKKIPKYEGYIIQLELIGDDLKESFIDIIGSWK